jgi:hypothetical protein
MNEYRGVGCCDDRVHERREKKMEMESEVNARI